MPTRPTKKKWAADAIAQVAEQASLGNEAAVYEALAQGLDPRPSKASGGESLLARIIGSASGELVQRLLDAGCDPNEVGPDGTSLLEKAAADAATMRVLLAAGADAERFGARALHAGLGRAEIPAAVRVLLDAGVDPNAPSEGGGTALEQVIMNSALDGRGLSPSARLLIERGADQTPALLAAVVNQRAGLVRQLLARGAPVDGRNPDGRTALHFAAEVGGTQMVPLLLAAGAKVDARDTGGHTPLHAACATSNEPAARALLAAGAKVDAASRAGDTPLMLLLAWPHAGASLVTRLLAAGASVRKTSGERKNALTLARLSGHAELVALLRKAGAKEQPELEAEVAPIEAELAERARVKKAKQARAVAYFESRHGKSGTGVAHGEQLEGAGRAARVGRGRVVVWQEGNYPPSYVQILPEKAWKFDRGQDPGPARRPAHKRAATLEARLEAIEARVAAAGVKLARGAKDDAIAAAEARTGVRFPDDYRAWLRRHDGTRGQWVASGLELLSLAGVQRYWKQQTANAARMARDDGVTGWFEKGWLPIATDEGADFHCLDLEPGSAAPGRVLRTWHDSEERPVEAPSFIDYLETIYWGEWE